MPASARPGRRDFLQLAGAGALAAPYFRTQAAGPSLEDRPILEAGGSRHAGLNAIEDLLPTYQLTEKPVAATLLRTILGFVPLHQGG